MSVYKSSKSPFWQYSFDIDGDRFYGSTKCTSRREAEAKEREIKSQERARLEAAAAASVSLQVDHVFDRYWIDIGQHHVGADDTERRLVWWLASLGKTAVMTEITHDDVARAVATRRLDTVPNTDPPRFIAARTVNDTTEQLKKVFTHLKARGVVFKNEPKWRDLMLPEPEERVRELHADEAERLDAAMRDDFAPLFDFARVTGKRKTECYTLRWHQVHWDTGWIERPGKGGRTVRVRITETIRDILWPLRGYHPEFVFTYVAQQTRGNRTKGERYPITKSGLNTRWRRTRKAAKLDGFRFHDFRHDVGTKVLRETGNLKLVQKLLDHRNIATTTKYAHVLDEEVGAAMEAVAQKSRKNHRKNHRTRRMKVV
jgi:integrase